DANVIIFDAFKSGCIAMEYLIKSGKREFIFITFHKFSETERKCQGCAIQTHDLLALEGMKSVLSKAGFNETCLTVLHEPGNADRLPPPPELVKMLTENELGIFAFGDARSVTVYRVAKWSNIDMHKNLSIVGLYNVSWAEILHPTLTSISINEAEIARLAADCIVNRKIGQRIVVEPKLIVRET
ncbi:MAG: substrate-binding domain-containing protein, partial [Victivallaceae bacterium]